MLSVRSPNTRHMSHQHWLFSNQSSRVDSDNPDRSIGIFDFQKHLVSLSINLLESHGMGTNLNGFPKLKIDLMITHLPAPLTVIENREEPIPGSN